MIAGMDRIDVAADARGAIDALVAEHAWLIDHGRAAEIAGLYLEDGRMLGVGPDLVSRAAIRAWGEGRAAMSERVSRHLCSNMRLVPQAGGLITGTVLLTVYRHDGPAPRPARPFAVGEYEDVYARDADGRWRFAERRLVVLFST